MTKEKTEKGSIKRLSLSLSNDEYESLRALAYVRKGSVSAFVRYLLSIHLQESGPLVALIQKVRASSANLE